MYIPCCVPGCINKKLPRHRFPNPSTDKARFDTWLLLVQNQQLFKYEPRRVYLNYRVCSCHFAKSDMVSNGRLNRTSVPAFYLPENPKEAEPSEEEPVASHFESDAEPQPSTSTASPSTSNPVPLCEELVITPPPKEADQSSSALLARAGVSSYQELTPKAKLFYKVAYHTKGQTMIYRKRYSMLKQKLHASKFDFKKSALSNEGLDFCMSQIARKERDPKGFRYTMNEKLMSLALSRVSGAAYRLLRAWFNIPSKTTISRMLQTISVEAGVNDALINSILHATKNLNDKQKCCIVLFDEIALTPAVSYDTAKDNIQGIGNNQIIDHAVVFMIKSIIGKWKQPISFDFSKGPAKVHLIQQRLKEIIKKLTGPDGLKIIAITCDQGTNNRAAIETMINDTRAIYLRQNKEPKRTIIINNNEIVPLYDVPHLLKGIRNNLLTKELVWEDPKLTVRAKWEDIQKAYYIDLSLGDWRRLPRITDAHIMVQKLKKMKVAYAAQTLSYSMAVAVKYMAEHNDSDSTGTYTMDKSAAGTAIVVKFFDDLFDSLNGNTVVDAKGKTLRTAVTESSIHLKFWQEAKGKLRQMYFTEQGKKKKIIPPSLKNFILTLDGFITIRSNLLKMNFKSFFPRAFNQDPLENFFGQIRQHRYRASNINAKQFVESFRSLLIKNILSRTSKGANCEDSLDSTLLEINNLMTMNKQSGDDTTGIFEVPVVYKETVVSRGENRISRPVPFYFLRNLKTYFSRRVRSAFGCDDCWAHVFQNVPDQCYKRSLHFSKLFETAVYQCYHISRLLLYKHNLTIKVRATIHDVIASFVKFPFNCDHKAQIMKLTIHYIVVTVIRSFCKYIDFLIKGKISFERKDCRNELIMSAVKLGRRKRECSRY